ncbi:type II toxin-antitoxin system RelE/ParE family toxin [Paraflavitalea pollutisoli]|uniref:type II toxin-antitoxin system RelE/ParE family toxin n=1 Tax=Paraflavitalea pollutisoli TaxID=3034143 RepID=UPI0023EDA462|nr:hypothetical protein [Paraflavitalea sp. H1-2-19X]
MDITFGDKKLEGYAENNKKCIQGMGKKRAELFMKRLNALHNALTLEDVRHLPGRFHELTNNRKGQWACDLDHPYRLIFVPHERPIPINDHGQFIWVEIKGVEIVEIADYH